MDDAFLHLYFCESMDVERRNRQKREDQSLKDTAGIIVDSDFLI